MMKIRNLFHKGGSLAGLRYKEKERKSRSWETDEETTREEYTLDWSQSKIFLVLDDNNYLHLDVDLPHAHVTARIITCCCCR